MSEQYATADIQVIKRTRFDYMEIQRFPFGCPRKAKRFADKHSDEHYIYEVD